MDTYMEVLFPELSSLAKGPVVSEPDNRLAKMFLKMQN